MLSLFGVTGLCFRETYRRACTWDVTLVAKEWCVCLLKPVEILTPAEGFGQCASDLDYVKSPESLGSFK